MGRKIDGFNMKKRIIISLSIVITITISAVLLIIFVGKYESNVRIGEYRNIKIDCLGIESYTYDLGEYFVYDYEESKNRNDRTYRITFYVDDGNDFYNNVIKTSKLYNSEHDYKQDGYTISYGFLQDKLHFIKYFIYPKDVEIVDLYGLYSIPYNLDDMENMLDPITYCYIPGPIARRIDYKNPDLNTPTLWINLYDLNLSYEEIVKVYSDLPYDFTEIHDDYLLIKGICYVDDFYDKSKLKELYISENYLCKITKFNDTVRYEIIDEYNK